MFVVAKIKGRADKPKDTFLMKDGGFSKGTFACSNVEKFKTRETAACRCPAGAVVLDWGDVPPSWV